MKISIVLVFALVLVGCGDGSTTSSGGDANQLRAAKPSSECGAFVSRCDSELAALCLAINGASSLKTQTVEGLITKVNGAEQKLTQDKTGDARGKLGDIESKLDQLEGSIGTPKAKINQGDFDLISGALAEAQACVG